MHTPSQRLKAARLLINKALDRIDSAEILLQDGPHMDTVNVLIADASLILEQASEAIQS